ncbi:MAG: AMP-binding protein [Deltaproteobacteria bacterium]|nr:AMP-binding protein [Deltaproteobacteria bacterium]
MITKTIDAQFMESCFKYGSKSALEQKIGNSWKPLSYSELWRKSEAITSGLLDFGIKKGDRIALLASPSPDWVVTYLSILRSDAIVVPIDKDLKSGEIRHILADCETRIIFTEEIFLDTLAPLVANLSKVEKIIVISPEKATGMADPALEIMLDDLVSEWHVLKKKSKLSEKETENFEALAEKLHASLLASFQKPGKPKESLSHLLSDFDALRRQLLKKKRLTYLADFMHEEIPSPPLHQPEDPAVIIYTSGTTGRSKGAVLSHVNIMFNVNTAVDLYRLTPKIHMLSILPIHHIFEQVVGIILPLSIGGTVSFVESLKKIGPNLEEVNPNFLLGVPAIFRIFHNRLEKKFSENLALRTLFSLPGTKNLIQKKIRRSLGGDQAVFISGGAALDPEIASGLREYGLNLFQGYGITETAPVVAVETPSAYRLGSVGRLFPGVEVRIDQPNDEGVGEILVKGPNVMIGYYNNSKATDEVLKDGWYYTGDLGRLDRDAFLYICGRVKNLIVTPNGKNVYPEEIEEELLKSDFIAEVMVYGHKVNGSAEEVYAQIYPDQEAIDRFAAGKGENSFSVEDVEKLIREEVQKRCKNLADYKRVKRFTLREDEFPKTTTKKIKRFVVEAGISAS